MPQRCGDDGRCHNPAGIPDIGGGAGSSSSGSSGGASSSSSSSSGGRVCSTVTVGGALDGKACNTPFNVDVGAGACVDVNIGELLTFPKPGVTDCGINHTTSVFLRTNKTARGRIRMEAPNAGGAFAFDSSGIECSYTRNSAWCLPSEAYEENLPGTGTLDIEVLLSAQGGSATLRVINLNN